MEEGEGSSVRLGSVFGHLAKKKTFGCGQRGLYERDGEGET